jgi:polyphenol oxidase
MLGVSSSLLSAIPGVSHRFFQRIGGTSPHPWDMLNTSHAVGDLDARVDENLARIRFQIGVPKGRLFSAMQVHGHLCLDVDQHDLDAVSVTEADALMTSTPRTAVGVRTADCVPILCAVDDGSAVLAIHAGWRGAVGGVVAHGIATLAKRADVAPSRIVAAIGPCISQDAFEVGDDVVTAVVQAIGTDAAAALTVTKAKAHIDLAGVVRKLLQQSGVERVDVIGHCTVGDARYFSHRRDHGKTGRQMSVIATTSPPDLTDASFA